MDLNGCTAEETNEFDFGNVNVNHELIMLVVLTTQLL